MRVKILGSAAGGAFPQWNCACHNCRGVRERKPNLKSRSQCQIALSANDSDWFLLNASPDLRVQVLNTPELQPSVRQTSIAARQSPITGVILTGADVDQVLGLLHLRELSPIRIYATRGLQRILRDHNILFNALSRDPLQSTWIDIVPGEEFSLSQATFGPQLVCRAVALEGSLPVYVHEHLPGLNSDDTVLGVVVHSQGTGERLGFFPAVPTIDNELLAVVDSCDLLLFDGTFWTDDELIHVHKSGRSAREMGHLPISGPGGTLEGLANVKRPRKIFVHINNTNPILDTNSMQYREVRNAGWEIAEDGWELRLQQSKQALAS